MSPEVPATGAPATVPELEALGRRLAEARQSRGLDLEVLADKLHLGKEQLSALESADLNRLPEPVFVIAQAKRVAGVLGIDLEPQLQALRQSRWLQQASRPAPAPVAAPTSLPRVHPGASAPPTAAAAGPVTAPAPSPPGPGREPGAPGAPPSRLEQTTAAARATGQGLPRLPLATATGLAVLLAALWGVRQWQARPASGTAAGRPASPAAIPTPRPAASAGTLVLQSAQPSWVEVRDNSGSTLFRGTLTGEKRFPLGTGLQVLAGRPDLVSAAIGAQPGQVLGPISDVRWRNLGTPAPASAGRP